MKNPIINNKLVVVKNTQASDYSAIAVVRSLYEIKIKARVLAVGVLNFDLSVRSSTLLKEIVSMEEVRLGAAFNNEDCTYHVVQAILSVFGEICGTEYQVVVKRIEQRHIAA